VVVQRVAEGAGNFGYNAATGEYGDMVADCMIAQVQEPKTTEEMTE
jgi:chaperonin GroEL